MELVWSTSNIWNLSLEEVLLLGKDFSKYVILDMGKIRGFLKEKSIDNLKNLFHEYDLKTLMIIHDEKVGEKFDEEKIKEILVLSHRLNIPYFFINSDIKPENLSFIVAMEVFKRNLERLKEIVDIPLVIKNNFYGIVNTFGKAYKLARSLDNVFLYFDIFHYYLSGEELDVFMDKDLSLIKFVVLKDAENVPRYYLREHQQLFPGDGVIPITQIFSYLREGGFDGYVVPEIRRPEYDKMQPKDFVNILFEKSKNILSNI
uniref:Sugar phosphate isomerase/epimerase n=1 Tax=Dictyoglomus thermophilum TaxID=14 RepID=A0A7C3RWH7_DICTH